jgi:cytosine/adenosine deaminase-related metal-dependent hydrolase
VSLSYDVVIKGGTLVTADATDRVLKGDLEMANGRIVAVGGEITPKPGARVVDARGMIVMPGFVQVHVHLCQVLFRGHAEDMPLLPWLKERIWPFEGAHTPETLAASARLGIAELLKGGTTCVMDMGTVRHTDTLFSVARDMGLRYVGGKAMMDKPSFPSLDEKTDASLREADDLASRWHGAEDGRLRYAYAPRFILSCTDRLMRETAALARKRGCMLHTHSSENTGEVEAVLAATGKRNVHALADLGYTGADVLLAHCVHVDDGEMELLAATHTRVAHCPSGNLKLASGIAPLVELLARKVPVALGADGAPNNNRLSGFTEMRLSSLLQKPRHGAHAMPARRAVRLATIDGARALGIGDDTGSLEVNKKADVVVVDCNAPHLRPTSDPFTMLVHAAEASDVRHVFVDGKWLVRDRDLVGVDDQKILDDAEQAIDDVYTRTRLTSA